MGVGKCAVILLLYDQEVTGFLCDCVCTSSVGVAHVAEAFTMGDHLDDSLGE